MRPRARTLPSADSESRHEFEPLQWEEQATGGLFADALSGGDAQTMQRERGRLLNYGIPACCCFMIIGVIVGVNSLTSVIEEQGAEAHRIANLESPSPPPWPPHTPPGTSQAFNVDVEVALLSTALASSDEVASVTMLGTLATAVAAAVPGATVELQAITNRRRALADVGRRLDPYDYTCGGHCTTNADCNDDAQTSLVTYRVVIVLPTLSEAQSLALRTAIQNAISQLKVDTGLSRGGASRAEWTAFFARARAGELDGVWRVTGVWSHFACADEPDHPANDAQDCKPQDRFGMW